ncbi:MAG: hypothetical protein WCT51_04235 [Candidatus Shapirobacteria bacterium]|jgi:hypothetical protein
METTGVGELYSKVEIMARSRSVVESDIKNTESHLDVMRNEGNELYDNLSESDRDQINDSFFVVIDNNEMSLSEKSEMIEKLLEEYKDQSNITKIVNLGFEIYKKENEFFSLKEECKPYVVEDIKIFANELSGQINFNKVVNYFLDNKNDEFLGHIVSIDDILSLREVIVSGDDEKLEQNDLYSLYSIEESLKKIRSRCDNHGFLDFQEKNNLSDGKNEKSESISKKSLLEKVNRVNEKLLETNTLHMIYRLTNNFKNPTMLFLKLLDHHYYFDSEVDDSHYDPRFLKAIEKRFIEDEKKLIESGLLPQNDDEKQCFIESKREEKTLIKIKIIGLEASDGKKLVVTEGIVKAFLEGTLPTAFLKIGKIEVSRERSEDDIDFGNNEDNANGKTKKVIVGEFKPILNDKGKLIYGNITIYEPFEMDNGDNNEKKEFFIRGAFLDTLTHEIGHGVHNDLGVDDLKKWENVMRDDETEITWYVGYAGNKSKSTKKREDFCESFMMFTKDPSLLQILSESRFRYMKELFETYMDSENLSKFKVSLNLNLLLSKMHWERKGFTREQIRNLYLSKL